MPSGMMRCLASITAAAIRRASSTQWAAASTMPGEQRRAGIPEREHHAGPVQPARPAPHGASVIGRSASTTNTAANASPVNTSTHRYRAENFAPMMMLDKKNLEIADIMLGWVEKNVRGSSKRR